MAPEPTIEGIAGAQRSKNARVITLALALLTLIAVPIVVMLGGGRRLAAFLVLISAGMGVAYWFARRGRLGVSLALITVCVCVEHLGSVVLSGALGPMPYLASIVVLLAAATERARWLWLSSVAALVTIALEGALTGWRLGEQQTIASATLFTAVVFVVSLLHVRGTERAFAIAQTHETARADAAAAALDLEKRYRLIADSADDLIALVDRGGTALYLSPSHERVLGLGLESTMGQLLGEHLALETLETAEQAFRTALDEGEARLELRLRSADGRLRILDSRMKRIDADPDKPIAVISRDVTEQRDLELRLLASERLEALGRLAGSVAHDFNNLLTVIGGSAELARRTLPPNHPAHRDVEAVLSATRTATALARQLLTFSRRQLVVQSRLDIASVLDAEREVLARLVGDRIHIEYRVEASLPAVLIPRAHVEQIAMNLAGNARDAMPAGGRLVVSLRQRRLADREVGDLVAGEYVELAVSDEGTGIPQDVLPHLFEPLFSTKGGRGTGLGLATCHGIAAQAGGAIEVESQLGRGSTFRVCLPVADGASARDAGLTAASRVTRVLVVDDDPGVRDMTTRMLRAEGYEVHTAGALEAARAILEDPSIHLDALVTDVMLGAERGTELLAPYRERRPGMRVVVTSGYAPDPSASDLVSVHGATFLPKPYGRDQLLGALRGGSPAPQGRSTAPRSGAPT